MMHDFPSGGDIHHTYHCTRKEYHLLLHNFLNNLESDKVKKLCSAAESDGTLFWKLLKGQLSTSQMSTFLVENKLITDKNLIPDMWANHFEMLCTPSVNVNFDSNFLTCVTASVADIFKSCAEDLLEPFVYPLSEVACVSSRLKLGTSGVLIDYERISHDGPTLWRHLFLLYQDFLQTHTVPENLKSGVILPFFKGKELKQTTKIILEVLQCFLLSVKCFLLSVKYTR